MATLYRRNIRVNVAGLTIDQLRMSFTVERDADQTQPLGKVRIHNLSRDTEQRIRERGDTAVLEAGYTDAFTGVLMEGRLQEVRRGPKGMTDGGTGAKSETIRQRLSRITTIEIGGEAHSIESLRTAVTLETFDTGTPVREVARSVIEKDMGLMAGPLTAIPAEAKLDSPLAGDGDSRRVLTIVANMVGATWYEDDGTIKFNLPDMMSPDAPSDISLSADSGLVRVPVVTDEGAEVVSLLQPMAKIGAGVTVESDHLSGRYKIVALRHEGDNWQGSFVTHYVLRAA